MFCLLYVDDIILGCSDVKEIEKVKETLSHHFQMKDMGELKYVLGVNVEIDNGAYLHQKQYIDQILSKYKMSECNPVSSPSHCSVKLQKDDRVSKNVDVKLYQSMVGSLIYLSTMTRPDITYAVGVVSKYNSNPNEAHLTAVKRIFRYLKGSRDIKMCFNKSANACYGFSDSDWGGDIDDRKSTSGYVFKVGDSVVSWCSKKQPTVALSTAEAELIALCSAIQELFWLRKLLCEIDSRSTDLANTMYVDNLGTIHMGKNPVISNRSKHIDVKYNFIREAVQDKKVELVHIESKNNVADIFTKALPREI